MARWSVVLVLLVGAGLALASFGCSAASNPERDASPSFDCGKAEGVDIYVCKNVSLADLDRVMSRVYAQKRAELSDLGGELLQHEQRDWLGNRVACAQKSGAAPTDCLINLYSERIAALTSAWGQGDAAAGERLATQCRMCHNVQTSAPSGGPTLYGIVGRKAGSLPGYNYSMAMKNSGVTWTPANLDLFLSNPKGMVPGTTCAAFANKDGRFRRNLIEYLALTGH